MKRVLLRLLLALCFVLALAVISLPWWFPTLSAKLISSQLVGHGWSVVQLSKPELSWHKFKLEQLDIKRSSGQALSLRLLEFKFSLSRLFGGQLDSLIIDQIDYVHVTAVDKIESLSFNTLNNLDSNLDSALQLNRLSINHAHISWPQQRVEVRTRIQLVSENQSLSGGFELLPGGERFKVELKRPGQLLITEQTSSAQQPNRLSITVAQNDDGLTFNVSALPNALIDGLTTYWKPVVSLPDIERIGLNARCQQTTQLVCQLDIETGAIAHQWLQLTSAQLSAEVSSWLKTDSLDLTFSPGAKLTVEQLVAGQIKTSALTAQLEDGFTISVDSSQQVETSSASWSIAPTELNGEGFSLNLGSTFINGPAFKSPNLEQHPLRFSTRVLQSHLAFNDHDYLISALEGELSWDGDAIKITSAGTLQSVLPFTLNARIKGPGGSGELIIADQDIAQAKIDLSELLGEPVPVKVLVGSIAATGKFSWAESSAPNVVVEVSLEQLGGLVNESGFSGLKAHHQITVSPKLDSKRFQQLKIKSIDVGIPISGFKANIRLRASNHGPLPRIMIKSLRASLLGGEIKSDTISYDPNLELNRFEVKIKDIDMSELINTHQLEGLEATGQLTGTLPIEVTNQGVRVANGKVGASAAGGRIRYLPSGGTEDLEKAAPGTDILFEALEDFQYQVLLSGVEYTPDGELKIALHLEGSNPKMDSNRPVHLNLNLEQNLLSLLKSLRFVDGLGEQLDQRIRDYFSRTYQQR